MIDTIFQVHLTLLVSFKELLIYKRWNIAEYDACYWGWNEKDKKDELKEKNPWFLIAKNSESQIVAFAHFKFDFDEEIPVLYCYEVSLYLYQITWPGMNGIENSLILIGLSFRVFL